MENGNKTIALLGQPNSGKSSLFNGLTGSHQHVGNWPGKTVEHKAGSFTVNGTTYSIVDLPGSYSLSAGSQEEVVTTGYIRSGQADLVAILVDSSQLERSLYMLADFIGTRIPAVLILNLMDVAKQKGIKIDTAKLSVQLGIPVIGFVAAERKRYPALKEQLAQALQHPQILNQDVLMQHYRADAALNFAARAVKQPADGIYTPEKQAILDLEQTDDGLMLSGKYKYRFIDELLTGAVQKPASKPTLSRFDKAALGVRSGKWVALTMILLALGAAMMVAAPIMGGAFLIPPLLSGPLEQLMTSLHVWKPLAEMIYVVIPNVLAFTLAMASFVVGVNLVFNFLEDIGYMARISFVFNNVMEKFNLQGKSMCSFLMSLGCNMAGVAGSRVIDNAGQRFLTMLLVWSIPCGTTLSLAPMLGGVFFGPMGSALVLVLIAVMTIGSMYLASRVFASKLVDQAESHGLVMELPPYHKPKWGHIIRSSLMKAVDIFWRAFKMIYLVSIVFYLLSYPWGGNVSLLVRVGQVISPVTEFFGMTWQMFMAYLSSMLTKESLLGVINALYSNTDIAAAAFNAKSVGISDSIAALLPQVITKAQALGFIMAIVFNVPCTMTVAATYRENHSIKWIALSVSYYVAFSLAISCIFYHIGLLIW
ncbi:ferrous iron transport protein B [uncultured Gemmiger sp.]|uniref:ferrous iron transport protein B n=1 Tax=uncultured Gemmiger sp. TaxID=1623490 RepID=UPI0025E8D3D3|nr:ferrous iron transport protein B [uncultured Gemmiger sp.]